MKAMNPDAVGRRVSECRSCKRPIVWARTEKGAAIPLDPEPVPGGNIDLIGNTAHYVTPDQRKGPLHMPHHAACPDAQRWRKAQRPPLPQKCSAEGCPNQARGVLCPECWKALPAELRGRCLAAFEAFRGGALDQDGWEAVRREVIAAATEKCEEIGHE